MDLDTFLGIDGSNTLDCHKCGESKPLKSFTKDARNSRGYRTWCKDCVNKYQKDKRRETSAESLVEAAIQHVYPKGLPDDLSTVDYHKLAVISGAPMPTVRLQVMRTFQAQEDAKLEYLRVKNEQEFLAKQTPENKAATLAAIEKIKAEDGA